MRDEPTVIDPLDLAIVRQLRATPGSWTDINIVALTHIDNEAIVLLSSAGMIEGKCRIRFELDELQEKLSLVVTMFGETKKAPIVQSTLFAAIPRNWIDADGKVKFHLRFISEGFHAIRRTDQGEIAILDLATTPGRVLDFVRRRNFFALRPDVKPSFRIESREYKQQQVGTEPSVSAISTAQASVGDVNVNVSNNIDLAGLSQILEGVMKPSTGASTKTQPEKKKTGRRRRDELPSTTKVLAGLARLHCYENGSVCDLDPRSVADIAKASDSSEASVSRALFDIEKEGHKAYQIACREKRLGMILAVKMGEAASYQHLRRDEDEE